jgi:hypothetical protein
MPLPLAAVAGIGAGIGAISGGLSAYQKQKQAEKMNRYAGQVAMGRALTDRSFEQYQGAPGILPEALGGAMGGAQAGMGLQQQGAWTQLLEKKVAEGGGPEAPAPEAGAAAPPAGISQEEWEWLMQRRAPDQGARP